MANDDPTWTSAELDPARETPSLVGAVIGGQYRIQHEIGRGGIGTVYLGQPLDGGAQVAIKIIDASHQDNLLRLMREAQAVTAIAHPHIVRIATFGTTLSGMAYVVMEHLEGMDLAKHLLATGPFAVERVIRIGRDLCGALQAAHQKGVIHRDVKPSNVILVEKEGSPEVVKLLDFGIAHVRGHSRITAGTTVMLGTPEYMSPEQIRGEEEPGPGADIYSVGCLLFELLADEPPFSGPMIHVLHQQLMVPAPRLSACAPHRGIPPHLDATISRALQKDAARRFANMAELSAALTDGAP